MKIRNRMKLKRKLKKTYISKVETPSNDDKDSLAIIKAFLAEE